MASRLAQALHEAREKKGLSLAALSEASGLDVATVWRIEHGITDPRFHTQLIPLIVALGIGLPAVTRLLTPTAKKGTP